MLGRIAQQVADLQHALRLPGQRDQPVGLLQGGGDRLLDQHVPAGPQRRLGQREMRLRRGGDDHRVARLQQRVEAEAGRAARLATHQGGARRIRIVDADQHGARGGGDLQRMEAPEMAGPGDADPQAARRVRIGSLQGW